VNDETSVSQRTTHNPSSMIDDIQRRNSLEPLTRPIGAYTILLYNTLKAGCATVCYSLQDSS